MEGYVLSLDFKDQIDCVVIHNVRTCSHPFPATSPQSVFFSFFFCKHKTREVFTLTYSHVTRALTLLIE